MIWSLVWLFFWSPLFVDDKTQRCGTTIIHWIGKCSNINWGIVIRSNKPISASVQFCCCCCRRFWFYHLWQPCDMKWRCFFRYDYNWICAQVPKVLALFDLVLLINGFYAIFDTWNEERNAEKNWRDMKTSTHRHIRTHWICKNVDAVARYRRYWFFFAICWMSVDDGTGFFFGMWLHAVVAMRERCNLLKINLKEQRNQQTSHNNKLSRSPKTDEEDNREKKVIINNCRGLIIICLRSVSASVCGSFRLTHDRNCFGILHIDIDTFLFYKVEWHYQKERTTEEKIVIIIAAAAAKATTLHT